MATACIQISMSPKRVYKYQHRGMGLLWYLFISEVYAERCAERLTMVTLLLNASKHASKVLLFWLPKDKSLVTFIGEWTMCVEMHVCRKLWPWSGSSFIPSFQEQPNVPRSSTPSQCLEKWYLSSYLINRFHCFMAY